MLSLPAKLKGFSDADQNGGNGGRKGLKQWLSERCPNGTDRKAVTVGDGDCVQSVMLKCLKVVSGVRSSYLKRSPHSMSNQVLPASLQMGQK